MAASTTQKLRSPQRHAWPLRPLNDVSAWNRLLQQVNPLWSLNEIRARIVARTDEDRNTVSLWLRPNGRWPGHTPGQHTALGVEIDGVMRRRVFSLSTPPRQDRRLRITLRRQAEGGVTDWLHRHARIGQIVTLSAPGGDFILPDPCPPRLLMLAGGSGITPMMAMLGQLAEQHHAGDIVLLQLCREADDRLFSRELQSLQDRLPGLRVLIHESARHGRLNPEDLSGHVPDIAQRPALLCGPAAWMTDIEAFYESQGLGTLLQQERFTAPRPPASTGGAQRIDARDSERVFTQNPGASLLESAEAAGLNPAFGCRAGLCRTCLCKKQSGTVRNLITGLRSDEPDEWVQLCISVAESDLELNL